MFFSLALAYGVYTKMFRELRHGMPQMR